MRADRLARDEHTCLRLVSLYHAPSQFLNEIKRDCVIAVAQIQSQHTDPAIFDVARAYLDYLHIFATELEGHALREPRPVIPNDSGSYLIAQRLGLVAAMRDWRIETGLPERPYQRVPDPQGITRREQEDDVARTAPSRRA